MESKVLLEPTIEESRFLFFQVSVLFQTESEKTIIELFRDPLCRNIVNPSNEQSRPLECQKCAKIFCLACVNELITKGRDCPACKAFPFTPEKVNKKLITLFESLSVTCRYKSGGCEFSAKISEIGLHEESCTFINDQLAQKYDQSKVELSIKPLLPQTEEYLPYKIIINRFQCSCGTPNTLKVVYDTGLFPQPEDIRKPCRICCAEKKITKLGVLKCSKCLEPLCETCAEAIVQDPDKFCCPKSHLPKFGPNKDLVFRRNCDLCGFVLSQETGVLKCSTCDWNLCRDCNFNAFKCKNNHYLRRVKDFTAYGTGLYVKNMFQCDVCKASFPNTFKGTLHCAKCQFDLCDRCMIISRTDLQRYCSNKHMLYHEYDLKKFSRDPTSLYAKNEFDCDVCKGRRSIQAGLMKVNPSMVLHCALCEYDLCNDCAKK